MRRVYIGGINGTLKRLYAQTMYIERFEYFCPDCKLKGIVTDVLVNPDLMIIRGICKECGVQSSYKAVDLSALRTEYDEEEGTPSKYVLSFQGQGVIAYSDIRVCQTWL
jgi:hypothetical protein